MKQKSPSEARSIGSFLSDPLFSARRLLTEAERLTQLQNSLRQWLPDSVRQSIRVAAEQEGTLILHADSAAALVAIRYRENELLTYLRQAFDLSATQVVTKIVPPA
ncbi:MAG: hypothetical protein JWR16_449 [Nevskia sp.]|nr:hypothetical protein [Nevskia sp.]